MGNTVINENESTGFFVTPTGITIGGKVKEYATYAAMLEETNPPKYASVVDASADPTVGSGSAFYKYSNGTWTKIHESESNDITWDTLEGKPNITSEEFTALVNNSHTHTNIGILNKFSVDPETGKLLYNGATIEGNGGTISAEIEARIGAIETTVDAHGITISNISGSMVKSVNGITPDNNGNVQITVSSGSGTVTSVNGVSPDSNGNVILNVGDVTATSSAFTSLAATVSTNTNNIALAQGAAAANLISINSLESRVTTVESTISSTVKYVTSMDIAASTLLNKVVMFVGATDQNYTKGHIYRCESSNNEYTWVDITGSTDISSLTTSVSTNTENIASLTTTVGSHTTDISSISNRVASVESSAHTHSNSTVLSKFSEGNNGAVLYDGNEIGNASFSTHMSDTNIHVTSSDKTEWSGKQAAITGTTGQFVKIGSNGTPVAETVDLSVYVKSINNSTPDANGNVTISTGGGDVTSAQFNELSNSVTAFSGVASSNSLAITTLETRVGTIEKHVAGSDQGIVISTLSNEPVYLNYNAAHRWKLRAISATITPIPKNFVDGAEAYVIIYGGVTVSWSAFAYDGNADESVGANHFDGIVWVGGNEPRAVNSLPYGFQMVKLMVVDNTVVAQLIADTCTDVAPSAIAEATARAESAAAAAAGDEAAVAAMTEEASEL